MANHVRSRVEVESPTKEIHEFMSKFDDSCTGLFETESGPNTCKVVFGDDWKFNIGGPTLIFNCNKDIFTSFSVSLISGISGFLFFINLICLLCYR